MPTARPQASGAPTATPRTLPPGTPVGTVSGQVRYQDGAGVAGVFVFAIAQTGLVGKVTTDGAGYFTFGRLPAGRLQISASRSDSYSVRSWAESGGGAWKAVDLEQGQSVSGVELRLERGAGLIGGRVFLAGQPVMGANVTVRRERGLVGADPCVPFVSPEASARTGSDGSFVIEGLPDDKFAVGGDAGAKGYAVVREVATGTTAVALALGRGAAIEGTVTDAQGQAPQGWRFTFAPAASLTYDDRRSLFFCWHRPSGLGAFGPDSFLSFLDNYPPQGRFALWGIGPGVYDFSFTDTQGRRAAMTDVRLGAGEQRTFDLKLSEPGGVTVAGKVLRADGTPIAGARAFSFDVNGPGDATTAADGSFLLKGARAGTRFTLRFQTAGDDTSRAVDVPAGTDAINVGEIRLGR